MTKVGRNDPCPCGSGRKFKKCCHDKRATTGYTRTDRAHALAKLDRFIGAELGPEDDAAFEEFWGTLADRAGELDDDASEQSGAVIDSWFAFDRPLDDGRPPVDQFLEIHDQMPAGERAFLEIVRDTSMRLYEVVDAVPGVSLTLRDLLEGDQVTVRERLGSRSISRFEWLAARVAPRGASGEPEIEAGLMRVPELLHESVRMQLAAHREDFFQKNPGAGARSFYKLTAPFFHSAWAGAILDPVVPALRNTDGEEMVVTRVTFEVADDAVLSAALDASAELRRLEDSGWSPRGPTRSRAMWPRISSRTTMPATTAPGSTSPSPLSTAALLAKPPRTRRCAPASLTSCGSSSACTRARSAPTRRPTTPRHGRSLWGEQPADMMPES